MRRYKSNSDSIDSQESNEHGRDCQFFFRAVIMSLALLLLSRVHVYHGSIPNRHGGPRT